VITRPTIDRRPVGEQLREWRQRRHLSQLDLAAEVEMSTRHLSFVETGRAQPSRVMVLRLAERLSVPLRERNALLIAAGFAPMYSQHAFSDPSMAAARAAVDLILTGHEPYPALLIDRYWMLVAANRIVAPMLAGVDESLLAPPMNMLRITLHPAGLAPRIANLTQWREHVLGRVQRDFELTADERLGALLEELRGYPAGAEAAAGAGVGGSGGLGSSGGSGGSDRSGRSERSSGGCEDDGLSPDSDAGSDAEVDVDSYSSSNSGAGSGANANANAGCDSDAAISGLVVPLKLHSPAGLLTLFSTTTVFGTAVEVTLSELMLEAFYPADEFTAQVLRSVAGSISANS